MKERELFLNFVDEGKEILDAAETDLLSLQIAPNDNDLINKLFRGIHTLKGSAGLVGAQEVVEVSHLFEDLLDRVRHGEIQITKEVLDVSLTSCDLLKRLLELLQDSTRQIELPEIPLVKKMISKILDQKTKIYQITLKFKKNIFETGTDPLNLLRELEELVTFKKIDISTSELPLLEDLNPYEWYLEWQIVAETATSKEVIEDIFVFVCDDNQIEIIELDKSSEVPSNSVKVGQISNVDWETNTIRINTEKVEKIMNSLAQLVIDQARVKDAVYRFIDGSTQIGDALEYVDKTIRNLQDEIMKIRMIPIGSTFIRYRRLVYELANELGKKVNFEISGEQTELDKYLIEKIADPIKHMLRNAIGHGIEPPAHRIAQGKPEHGTIWLRAFHQQGFVIIQIEDDGCGLDPEKIKNKAIKNGLLLSNQKLSDEEIYNLIFLPGLSTSEEITDLSGRGVGLDVVKNNINSLRGSVSVLNRPGEGLIFTIKLPLTLAIMDGMLIRVGREKMILPLSSIIQFLRPENGMIKRVAGANSIVEIRGEYLPLIYLGKVLKLDEDNRNAKGILVLVEEMGEKACLYVDEIINQQQVVIKNLKENYRSIDGFGGGTILGDGSVALIVDVGSIIKMTQNKSKGELNNENSFNS